MLVLNEKGLAKRAEWEAKGYTLPIFDRVKMMAETEKTPRWVHFGAGNIFRAFQCAAAQKMLNEGWMDTGIVAVEGFDYEIVEKGYRPCDNYSLLVTLKASGNVEKTVVGSIAASCILDKPLFNWSVGLAFLTPLSGAVSFAVIYAVFQWAMRYYRSTGS